MSSPLQLELTTSQFTSCCSLEGNRFPVAVTKRPRETPLWKMSIANHRNPGSSRASPLPSWTSPRLRVWHHGTEHQAGEDPQVEDTHCSSVSPHVGNSEQRETHQSRRTNRKAFPRSPQRCSPLRQEHQYVGPAHQVATSQRCHLHCPRWGRRHRWSFPTVSVPSLPKALSVMSSPLQPELTTSQFTSCCSLKGNRFPVAIDLAPSRDPVVENVHREPQESWFFTGVTAPFVDQPTASRVASWHRASGM